MGDQQLVESNLTHSQLQIWVGQRLNAGSPLYNMAFAFTFDEELDADLFGEAWRRVVDSSDALRTYVEERDGAPVRHVREPGGASVDVLDFRDQADPDRAFRRWCQDRCMRPLRLDQGLAESVLVQLGNGRIGWYLNQHHLIADAWSTQLVYREVAAEYEAGRHGAMSDRARLLYYPTATALKPDAAPRAAAVAHWTERLSDRDRRLPFYGRWGEPTGTASTRLTLTLDDDQSEALNQLCVQEGFVSLSHDLSRFAVFAALIVSWLRRISGQREIVLDAPVASRPTSAAKRAIGLFMEIFPFAVDVESSDTFRTLGARCLDEATLVLRHALPGTSAPSASIASNVVLNFLPGAFGDFAGVPVEAEWIHPASGDSVHALRVQVHDLSGSGRYTLHFDFNDGVMSHQLRTRSLEHFERVLAAFLDDIDQTIDGIDVRTSAERAEHGSLDRATVGGRPDRSVTEAFEAVAEAHPNRTALRQGSVETTFGRLRTHAQALAVALVERGVGPGDRVAILGRRSSLVVAAVLGVLRARAAYVPIDRDYPDARVRHILQDSGARVLLVDDEVRGAATPDGLPVLPIAEALQAGSGQSWEGRQPRLDELAYLIYTSGSTGQPKGVLVEHGGLANYVGWASRQYVRGDSLVFPLFTSLSFDLTVTSLFLPVTTGGTLEIYPESDGPVDAALMDVVAANAVDFIKLTPSHLSLFRQLDISRSRIRRMVVGGEDFRTHLAASVHQQFGGHIEIYNEYGPTEAVVGCAVHRFDPAQDTQASVPIGVPIDHVRLQVLNDALAPVPAGVPGELWVSGVGVARGYHGLERATADRFHAHPDKPGWRRYRTGDRVRLMPSGVLEYIGRLDRQLKLSGFRIEPAEIEAAVLEVPGVEACVAAARPLDHHRLPPTGSAFACVRCGLNASYPGIRFDDDGVCHVCRAYESIREAAQSYFRTMDDLRELFEASASSHDSPYDCMLLLSGGKDSTYALCRLVEMGQSVYAFTLDNGFISEGAKNNMRQVTEQLGVPLEFGQTPAMNAIFRDSLTRFSNVCNGCFKTIYTLSTNRARELGIPLIVTGLSRGQMFETRLTEEMFRDSKYSPDEVDAAVLEARKVYHRVDDEVARSLDVRVFQDDRIFDEVRFVDFYRYCDAGLDEVFAYLKRHVPWVRPADTGRSTNCLINDAGIYVHRKQRGYHNYALPYSWDVRLGHKTRDESLAELSDQIDVEQVRVTLAEIGYDEGRMTGFPATSSLTAFYVARRDVSETELRRELSQRLPEQLVPASLTRVDAIPLTPNGKVDMDALPWITEGSHARTYRAPEGPVEEYLAQAWQRELEVDRVGADDNFFELGGTSLAAMEVMIRLCREYDISLPLQTLFQHPTLAQLARVAEQRILDEVSELTEADR